VLPFPSFHIFRSTSSRPEFVRRLLLDSLRLRLSEAVRAYKHFLKHRSLEFEVEVSKRRRSEKRLVVIPEFLLGWVDSCMEDLYKNDKQI